jgi:hypothetical protein
MPGFAAFHIATDEPMVNDAVSAPAAPLPSVDEGGDWEITEREERPD